MDYSVENDFSTYIVVVSKDNGEDKGYSYFVGLKKYSFDNKKWKNIPQSGVKLKKNKSIYIKATLYNVLDPDEEDMYFGGSDKKKCKDSNLYLIYDSLDYISPYFGDVVNYFDLIKGSGYARKERD